MTTTLELLWVSWLNSARWRTFAKDSTGASVMRSPVFRKLDTARRYALTTYKT
jgi:hypothetical protein